MLQAMSKSRGEETFTPVFQRNGVCQVGRMGEGIPPLREKLWGWMVVRGRDHRTGVPGGNPSSALLDYMIMGKQFNLLMPFCASVSLSVKMGIMLSKAWEYYTGLGWSLSAVFFLHSTKAHC